MKTYTMTLTDVQAWQVAPDGSLPEEVTKYLTAAPYRGQWEDRGYWVWYHVTEHCYEMAYPGDWIVSHEYGFEAMTDEHFRACCREVDDAS